MKGYEIYSWDVGSGWQMGFSINYVLGRENEDELGLTCQLGKCSFYNKW